MNKKGRVFRVMAWVGLIPLLACLLGGLALAALGLRVEDARSAYASGSRYEPVPTLLPDGYEALDGTTITIWFLDGPRFFSAEETFARELARGKTDDGRLAYRIEFDEAGFNQYLRYWFLPPGDEMNQAFEGLRDPRVDLRRGGLTLLADAQVGGQWQPVGLLYNLDDTATQLNFVGIEYQGNVVTTLPGSFMDDQAGATLEGLANRALRELTFIDESGTTLMIRQIAIEDDQAVVLATNP